MYKCLPKNRYEGEKGYAIVAIRREDLEPIRVWRNAQIDILRQHVPISAEEQQSYFSRVVWPSLDQIQPQQTLFSFLLHNRCIGYGGLTHVDWDAGRAEVSFLLDPDRVVNQAGYVQDFLQFLALLSKVAFQELNFHRLFTETFAYRTEHMAVLEKFGFRREGVLREHIFKRNQWFDSVMHGLLVGEFAYEK